ncbi:MAG: carboxypeptidase regulatory-like domain-containing protein [Gemmatimonadaceae bacterium]|nr:carboxypeptidase regulatory-like domain-containing protein [Gemmatimonadaceae bacterium]
MERLRGVQLLVLAGVAAGCLLWGASARAQGALEINVLDDRTGDPLAYAVVSIPTASIERFTDARGRLTIPVLRAGSYAVDVRRLGFLPHRGTVTVVDDDRAGFTVRMQRIAQRLAGMQVSAERACLTPGTPDPTRDPLLAALVSLLKENADRFRLLSSQYPFIYTQQRALGDVRDSVAFVAFSDRLPLQSDVRRAYKEGDVVRRVGGQYTMSLPTLLDLADQRFARSHCFVFAGVLREQTPQGLETWARIEVRASDSLKAPDMHGVFYLDSATAELRRMEVELSRPDLLPKQLSTIASVRVSTEFANIANGLSIIRRVCALTRYKPSDKPADAATQSLVPFELQQTSGFVFTTPPPDVASTVDFALAPWLSQTYLPRDAVWCA